MQRAIHNQEVQERRDRDRLQARAARVARRPPTGDRVALDRREARARRGHLLGALGTRLRADRAAACRGAHAVACAVLGARSLSTLSRPRRDARLQPRRRPARRFLAMYA